MSMAPAAPPGKPRCCPRAEERAWKTGLDRNTFLSSGIHSCDGNAFLSQEWRHEWIAVDRNARECPFPCAQTTPGLVGGRRRRHGRTHTYMYIDVHTHTHTHTHTHKYTEKCGRALTPEAAL